MGWTSMDTIEMKKTKTKQNKKEKNNQQKKKKIKNNSCLIFSFMYPLYI